MGLHKDFPKHAYEVAWQREP